MASANNDSGTPASAKREGTMIRTVREAKEYSYGCECNDADGEHDHDAETGATVVKPGRQTTMEKTAQEGIQYLKDQRKDTLLLVQGLVPAKDNVDAGDNDDDDDDEDTEQTGDDDDEASSGENGHNDDSDRQPAKMAKHGTMLVTAKEGEDLLTNYMGGKPDPDARTRGQQRAREEEDEPETKKPRRTHTMQETAQEAQQLLIDPHTIGGTRSETAAVKKAGEQVSPGRQRKH